MGQSRGNLQIRRWLTIVAVVITLGAVLITARTTGNDRWTAGRIAVVVVFGALAACVMVVLLRHLAGIDHEASDIAAGLAAEPEQRRLLTRWLQRARWTRWIGGFCGVLAWLLATNAKADVLLFGTAGIALGAVAAELHHLRRARGPRTARLEVRTVGDYLMPYDARQMIRVAVVALVLAVAAMWSSHTRSATWWALAAIVVLGLCRLAQWRVATRARPALSPSLTRADDFVRELAVSRGLARPATFLALALIARAGFAMRPSIDVLGTIIGFAAWCYAYTLWWHNRRLGLDFVLDEPRQPILS
jgi:hypothetical protein